MTDNFLFKLFEHNNWANLQIIQACSSLSDEQLVEVVLKGKKVEKPPHMPAYGEKGVTADQAKDLVAHMKQLKAAP